VRRYEHIPPLRVNRSELQQVLLNLLINARDAMPGAGGEIKIELARTDSGIRIVFSDTGEGIPAEHLGKVFDPFFTSRQARSDGGRAGTGLGLYVTYWIVKRHGGSIDVQSVVGRGTTFTINLPLQETAGSEAGGTGIQRVRP
jgi:two-component system NtrC family sensor kinase